MASEHFHVADDARSEWLRVRDIVRPQGILPISASTWWSWVRSSKAPAPYRLSSRVTCWKRSDIERFISGLAREAVS